MVKAKKQRCDDVRGGAAVGQGALAGKARHGVHEGGGLRRGGDGDEEYEPVLTQVLEEVGRLRAAIGGQGMVPENSLVYWSKSNGLIETTIQSVQGLVRTRRSSLEARRTGYGSGFSRWSGG